MSPPSFLLFALSLLAIGLVLLFNPLFIALGGMLRKSRERDWAEAEARSISLITVVHNASDCIAEKIENSLSLEVAGHRPQIIICSDGSTDSTDAIVRSYASRGVELVFTPVQEGKNAGLNRAVSRATGDILVFTDADALLQEDALRHITAPLKNPQVGGVCGQRRISESEKKLGKAQKLYVKLDSGLKVLESRIGSITSNDGKLYAIRRSLFRPVANGVTDDLFLGLTVVEQGKLFLFEPNAVAYVRLPSRSSGHELLRRRRIVNRSLHGLWIKRNLLNPFRHKGFALRLLVNKVLRRFLPLFLILLLVSSAAGAKQYPVLMIALIFQMLFYATAVVYGLFFYTTKAPGRLVKLASVPYYFCLGNLGTLLGLFDFLIGKRHVVWVPRKTG